MRITCEITMTNGLNTTRRWPATVPLPQIGYEVMLEEDESVLDIGCTLRVVEVSVAPWGDEPGQPEPTAVVYVREVPRRTGKVY